MSLAEGQVICNGKYEILRLIGEGGQSRVWLAREVARDLEVAIKEPLAELSALQQADLQARFERERRISGQLIQLDAPSVVRVLTTEQHEGQTLLVMELCAGGSLATRLQSGPLPVEAVLRIAGELCDALAVVHDKLSLVHRDIKPSNVLFSAAGHAKLGDFGLAQTEQSLGRSRGMGTPHPGTVAYMSPEQADSTGYLTPASDLYALGCLVFEMLTGRRYRQVRPGTAVRELQRGAPEWLDAIVGKLLEPDMWQRYQTAREVREALQAGPQLHEATPPPAAEAVPRAKRPAGTGITLSAGMWAVIAVAIVGLMLLLYLRPWESGPGPAPTAVPMAMPTAMRTATAVPTLVPTDTPRPASPTPEPVEPLVASITYPNHGSVVGETVMVSGVISGLQPGQRAFLCAQSTGAGQLIFPQGEIVPDASGGWAVESVYRSAGYAYDTFVAVTANPESASMLADEHYRGYGIRELPPDTSKLGPTITVNRGAVSGPTAPIAMTTPKAAPSGAPEVVTDVVSRGYFTCALIGNGKVRCWGDNSYGQLGDGSHTSRAVPGTVYGIDNATAVAAGAFHACALLADGGVRCWGRNDVGQLGDGTFTDSPLAVYVTGLRSGVEQVSANGNTTCARMQSGAAKCWGMNNSGQVGDGTTTNRSTPVTVSGLSSGVVSIVAGYLHSCAIIAPSSRVVCWGANSNGEIGDGTATDRLTPVPVVGLSDNISGVSSGGVHTCALHTSGSVQCWGANAFGQLGNGLNSASSRPVDVSGLSSNVAQISAFSDHTCALLDSGATKCWGRNDKGQVGDGTNSNRNLPTQVSGLSSGVIRVLAGLETSCAVMNTGGLECWGGNAYGQVGDGTTSVRYTPVDVVGLQTAN
jgi:alpha-tubulin suppressor-like RCC1 family protein